MQTDPSHNRNGSRRIFLKKCLFTAFWLPEKVRVHNSATLPFKRLLKPDKSMITRSIIGNYGSWVAASLQEIPILSWRSEDFQDLEAWKVKALEKVNELLSVPEIKSIPTVLVEKKETFDGLEIEYLSWQLPYGEKTKAVLLKPKGVDKPLPAILALHDHGGKKYYGYEKIVCTQETQHPLLAAHQTDDYGGEAWANQVAKRGYVVLVHDTFTFGSRRVRYEEVDGFAYGPLQTEGKVEPISAQNESIEAYNQWASEHEHVMAKSLFSAGLTWPGIFLREDQVALSILSARPEVDSHRIGCGGLSGGGLRTVYLAGLDSRIKCAVCVGFMTTWRDFILHKSYTHTWMTYTPLLPKFLEFSEILGLRAPLPTLVQNNNQDELYTLSEMKNADQILKEVYRKAGVPNHYKGLFYEGPHKFDVKMQSDAFAWFDQWL
jgi:dienelactone hydrolase